MNGPSPRRPVLAKVALVAIDLDGTLLGPTKTISRADREAIETLRRASVHVAIVSGRRFVGLAPLIETLPEEVIVVSNSGAIVRESRVGPVSRRRLLPLDVAREVIRFSHAFGIEPIVHEEAGRLRLRLEARGLQSMKGYVSETKPPPIWVERLELTSRPVQIGFAGGVERIRGFEAALGEEAKTSPSLRFAVARTEYDENDLALLDVLNEEATKGRALRFLADRLGVAIEATMAIGDNWNDLDMLQAAGLGVVMGNAPEALRARGLEQTRTNGQDGVAHAIARFALERG